MSVNIVFRIDPYPSDNDPEKKSLQLCRGRDNRALRRPDLRGLHEPVFHHSCLSHPVEQA